MFDNVGAESQNWLPYFLPLLTEEWPWAISAVIWLGSERLMARTWGVDDVMRCGLYPAMRGVL